MFCVNCGKPVESHFKFCPYCATNISTGTQPSSKNTDFEIVAGKLIKYIGSDVDVVIPDNVIEIGNGAFRDLKLLKSVIIPNSTITIGEVAFWGCSNLSNVTIGNSVKEIGSSAFRGCSNLISITIPDSVTKIDSCAFADCRALTNVTIGNSVREIGVCAFSGCVKLVDITIPNSVTNMHNSPGINLYVFEDCFSLCNIKYPSHLTIHDFIGTKMFNKYASENRLCPKCGRELSFFGNCKKCK